MNQYQWLAESSSVDEQVFNYNQPTGRTEKSMVNKYEIENFEVYPEVSSDSDTDTL
jgi:hypothetical protein